MESQTMSKNEDNLTGHDYDGIKELDNDLPKWWLWLFYLTIIFGFIYMIHYHVLGTGDLSAVEYQKEMNPDWVPEKEMSSAGFSLEYRSPFYSSELEITPRILNVFENYVGPKVEFNVLIQEAMRRADSDNLEKLKATFPEYWAQLTASGGEITPAAPSQKKPAALDLNYEPLTDASSLSAGKQIYITNCASCHGQLGEGMIGPNMTDDYYIHGGGINDIIAIIINGVPAKGMISWKGILNNEQIHQIGSYLMTLRGTNPPNQKAPQGELIKFPE